MSEVFQYFFTKAAQELHPPPQLLGDFNELNWYKKVSGRRIIIYEAIFKLGLR